MPSRATTPNWEIPDHAANAHTTARYATQCQEAGIVPIVQPEVLMDGELLSLYLVRHGQTEWSLSGQHTGSTDIPLTAYGEDEAGALTPWLMNFQFGLVVTSPLQRARRTCELVGLAREAEIEPDVAEWDYSDYEGKLSSNICQGRPGCYISKKD